MKRTGTAVIFLLLFSAFAELPKPGVVFNSGMDLLSSFPLTVTPVNVKDRMRYRHFKFSVSNQQHPEHWKMVLSGNPEQSEG